MGELEWLNSPDEQSFSHLTFKAALQITLTGRVQRDFSYLPM
jgi:hypothetical protein